MKKKDQQSNNNKKQTNKQTNKQQKTKHTSTLQLLIFKLKWLNIKNINFLQVLKTPSVYLQTHTTPVKDIMLVESLSFSCLIIICLLLYLIMNLMEVEYEMN